MSGEFTKKSPITRRRQNLFLGTTPNCSSSPPIADTKPIPNYLKPPTSSCHDLCKYGHKHSSESKWRPPICPKQRKKSGIHGVVLNPELRVSGKKERQKTEEVIKGNISPPKKDIFVDKETTFVEDPKFNVARDRIEMEMPEERVFELSDASTVREIKIYDEEPSVNSSPVRTQDVPIPSAEESSEDSLSMMVEMSHSEDMHHDALTSDHDLAAEIPLLEDETVKMVETKKNTREAQINGSELHNGKRGQIARKNTERQKVDKVFLKPSVTKKRDSVPKDGTTKKTDASIQPRPRERAMPLTNKPKTLSNSVARPQHGESEVKDLRPVKQPALVKPPINPLRKLKKRVEPASSLGNNASRSGGSISSAKNVKEKTFYMIEAKQEVIPGRNQANKGIHKGKLSCANSDSVSGKDRTSNKKVVSQSYTKPTPPPHKMAFRRGRIINVQAETTVPTRIKFRRVKPGNPVNRVESGTGGNKVVARRKRNGGSFGGIASTPPTGTPSVKLRHQDSPQDKSGALRSLFNHVIEETASKLVETRKSKVKALVGAFETVISLQEK